MSQAMSRTLEREDLVNEIRDYICGTMLIGLSDQSIEADESLVQRGVVDSTGVLELVEFLQDRYGIRVEDEEITTDNLDTLNSITAYVQHKLAPAAAGQAR
jgi:acyl carrier protein